MFQIVLFLGVGILIGWNFHIFFVGLEPQSIIKQTLIDSQNLTVVAKGNVKSIVYKETPKESVSKEVSEPSFQMLLEQDRFSDAMAFYMEANDKQLRFYQPILKVYFHNHAEKTPQKIVEEILQYIDIEPNHRDTKKYLAQIYKTQGKFEEAIKVLLELQENYVDELEQEQIENRLKSTIQIYITNLIERKDFPKTILFLEEMIARNLDNSYYIITLAEIYANLNQYEKSKKLLEELKYSTTYATKVEMLLREIEKRKRELEQYSHKIPLKKNASHYSVNLTINNTPLTLLLDTGATYTFIDEEKAPSLNILKEVQLNSAGGEITAQLCRADRLMIDDIVLKDFELTVASFKHENADGLLGMNFFEQFKFMIDQERSILYLSDKIEK